MRMKYWLYEIVGSLDYWGVNHQMVLSHEFNNDDRGWSESEEARLHNPTDTAGEYRVFTIVGFPAAFVPFDKLMAIYTNSGKDDESPTP